MWRLGEVLETLFGHDQVGCLPQRVIIVHTLIHWVLQDKIKLQFKLARAPSLQLVERLAEEVAVQVLHCVHCTGLHVQSRTSVRASSLLWLDCSTASRRR